MSDIRYDECSQVWVSEEFNAWSPDASAGSWRPRINWRYVKPALVNLQTPTEDLQEIITSLKKAIATLELRIKMRMP